METDKEDNKIIFVLCAVINKYLSLISDKKTISIYHIRIMNIDYSDKLW